MTRPRPAARRRAADPGAAPRRRLIPTALGPLLAEATAVGISRLVHAGVEVEVDDDEETRSAHADRHLDLLVDELEAYLDGELREFTVPVDWDAAGVVEGFAREVYREIRAVPYAHTAAYGQISHDAGRPRNARQVGRLCSRVPVVLVIPVHRITRADGGLGDCPGYRRDLIVHEKLNVESAEAVAIRPRPSGRDESGRAAHRATIPPIG